MVYKSSFGRGFNSSILNSYVMSLLVCSFLSIILIFLSSNDSQILKKLRFSTISITKPLFIIVGKPLQMLDDSLNYVSKLKNANQINIKLREKNKLLTRELNKNNFLLVENYRLRNLLKIKEVDYVKKITARIIVDSYKDGGSLIYIDAGERDGLKINDIVFNEEGLLGRIAETGLSSSKVLTIFDENSVIPVISIETNKSFFIQGDKQKLKLKHIERRFDLKHGEIIVSTDAAGYFREGIRIGKVFKDLNEVFVIPFAKYTDSIYVNVLVYNFTNLFED